MSGAVPSLDQIGKYEILERIGSGGFAIVYKGYDPFIKRPVAIKVCFSRDEETRQRFFREAEIAGALVHRNITTVYDFGVHDQMPYLVEEHLSGEDLAHLIRRREPVDLATRLRYLVEIASGLGYAHQKNVIHRDIKPGNIRVLDDGSTKIMDFGTAKLAHVESHLTQSGMTLGTVAYLSPERLLGRPNGLNSDIFSFGVLAYELLAFSRPFSGRNIPRLIDSVLNLEPRPLHEVWPDCPPRLAKVVHRCLEKDPEARYADCDEVLAGLRDVAENLTGIHVGSIFVDPGTQPGVGMAGVALGGGGPVSGSLPNVKVSGLLERARELHASGKHERALLMLEEVLELSPSNAEAAALEAACRTALGQPIATVTAEPVYDGPSERRARKIREATESIRRYADDGRFVEAGEALRFAYRLLGTLDDAKGLRLHLIDAIRGHRRRVVRDAEKLAQSIVDQMVVLQQAGRLDADTAERCAALVAELDQDDLAARDLAALVRRRVEQREEHAKQEQLDRKRLEAILSIESMLDRGDVATASQALDFAIEKLGDFEEVEQLRARIDEMARS